MARGGCQEAIIQMITAGFFASPAGRLRHALTQRKERYAFQVGCRGFESRPPLHGDNETGDRDAPCLCLSSGGSRRALGRAEPLLQRCQPDAEIGDLLLVAKQSGKRCPWTTDPHAETREPPPSRRGLFFAFLTKPTRI